MKAKIKCKIESFSSEEGMLKLSIIGNEGRVDTKMIPAQDCKIIGNLFLKHAIANQIKIGSTIILDILIEDNEII